MSNPPFPLVLTASLLASPENMSADLKAKGIASFKSKDFKGAVAQFTKAIEVDAKDETLWANRSAANLKIHEVAAAIADVTRGESV